MVLIWRHSDECYRIDVLMYEICSSHLIESSPLCSVLPLLGCNGSCLYVSVMSSWQPLSGLLVIHSSCQELGDRTYRLFDKQNVVRYEFCLTDDTGDLKTARNGLVSIRHLPSHDIVERDIANFLTGNYISNVLYITDRHKYSGIGKYVISVYNSAWAQ